MDYKELVERLKKTCWGESAHRIDDERKQAATAIIDLMERAEKAEKERDAYDKFLDFYKEGCREALVKEIYALREPTREQVEKLRGEWAIIEYDFFTCTRCENSYYNGAESTAQAESYLNSGNVHNFCPICGAPMTDKAIDVFMEKLEAIFNECDTV